MQYEGGYLNNNYLKINIEFNKSIKFKKKFLNAINYLQEIPLRINKNYLKFLLDLDLEAFSKEFQELNKGNIKNYMGGAMNKLKMEEINIINNICSTLYFAKLYSDKIPKFYIPMHYDFRGRVYCSSYPLHFYTMEIFKGLYTFYSKNELAGSAKESFYKFFKANSGNS
jgi:hypothetical protein